MAIYTQRLILRRWELSDKEDLFLYAQDPDVGPITGWPPHKTIEDSINIINEVYKGQECYAICQKEDNKAIGTIELMLNPETPTECELGFWLGKPFWGKGYMPEAAKALIKRAFTELNMETIWVGYYDGNQKSKRVIDKLGFEYHHTDPNSYVVPMNEYRICHMSQLTRESWTKSL